MAPCLLAPWPCPPRAALKWEPRRNAGEVAQRRVDHDRDVAAAAAVAAVGPALGHVRLAPERDDPVAAGAAEHVDPRRSGNMSYSAAGLQPPGCRQPADQLAVVREQPRLGQAPQQLAPALALAVGPLEQLSRLLLAAVRRERDAVPEGQLGVVGLRRVRGRVLGQRALEVAGRGQLVARLDVLVGAPQARAAGAARAPGRGGRPRAGPPAGPASARRSRGRPRPPAPPTGARGCRRPRARPPRAPPAGRPPSSPPAPGRRAIIASGTVSTAPSCSPAPHAVRHAVARPRRCSGGRCAPPRARARRRSRPGARPRARRRRAACAARRGPMRRAHQLEPARPVGGLDDRLRRHRAHPRLGPADHRAHAEVVRLHGHAELRRCARSRATIE